jgi:hypothetical protein
VTGFGKTQIDRLQRYVRGLRKDPALSPIISSINSSGEAYIFGGAPRDVAFLGSAYVNDLDIFVSGRIDSEAIARLAGEIRSTNFGGLRIATGTHDIDLWELSKSYAFRFDSQSFVSVERLLKTVCFSTDSIAVSLKSGRVFKNTIFDRSFRSRRLDFVVHPDREEAVVAARIARLVLKLNMTLTPAVASYFVSCVESLGSEQIINAESRWKSRRLLNEIAIEQVLAEIRTSVDKAFERLRNEGVDGVGQLARLSINESLK